MAGMEEGASVIPDRRTLSEPRTAPRPPPMRAEDANGAANASG